MSHIKKWKIKEVDDFDISRKPKELMNEMDMTAWEYLPMEVGGPI